MRRILAFLIIAGALVFILWIGERVPTQTPKRGEASFAPSPAQDVPNTVAAGEDAPRTPRPETAIVSVVIDGDTVRLNDGRVLRYIGMDAPETSQGSVRECFAAEATARNRELVEGKVVRLEKDVSEADRYDRLLRYVYVDNLFVSEALVRDGYATAYPYPPDVKYRDMLRRADAEAKAARRGLWGTACGGRVRGRADRSLTTQDSKTRDSIADRDCSDFRTRAAAQAFFESHGGPAVDPHKLDQDRDGLACESRS